jgi:hypothetical protein
MSALVTGDIPARAGRCRKLSGERQGLIGTQAAQPSWSARIRLRVRQFRHRANDHARGAEPHQLASVDAQRRAVDRGTSV